LDRRGVYNRVRAHFGLATKHSVSHIRRKHRIHLHWCRRIRDSSHKHLHQLHIIFRFNIRSLLDTHKGQSGKRGELFMRNFKQNTQGFFYTAVVIVIVLFTVDISAVTVLLVTNRFFDLWDTVTTGGFGTLLEGSLRNVGPIVIVIVNIGLIVLLVVSAWKRQTIEEELPL
jgi:hypothetical protein